ncbi:MAG: branched-chain amino acid transaminase [Chloroflexi bacterium]|nr:branched-chain amino acid transaminase [Chloroflexota bacterium]
MATPQAAPAHPKYVWWNGELVEWDHATVHVTAMEWVGVSAVFEGIKAYANPEEEKAYVFRLSEHMQRFDESMRLMRMEPEWNAEQLSESVLALLRANGVREDTYIRPFAYRGRGGRSFRSASENAPSILINTHPFTTTLKTGKTITTGVSSWTRISDNVMPPRVKAVANYQNSQLAWQEVMRNGYDDAIILNERHKVAEAPGACVMLVKRGRVITPPVTAGVLESITRSTLLQMFEEQLGTRTEEREVDRTELYLADEVFLCGTGAEVTPVVSVDRYPVGNGQIGPITSRMIDLYHDVVRGLDAPYDPWRTAI